MRERIHSRTDPRRRMAGVLLHTASPDSEGSLGGLVALLGTKERLPELLGTAEVGRTPVERSTTYRILRRLDDPAGDPPSLEPQREVELSGPARYRTDPPKRAGAISAS